MQFFPSDISFLLLDTEPVLSTRLVMLLLVDFNNLGPGPLLLSHTHPPFCLRRDQLVVPAAKNPPFPVPFPTDYLPIPHLAEPDGLNRHFCGPTRGCSVLSPAV